MTTIPALVSPVCDRTEQDIRLQTPKAYLNVVDYQRIERNLQTLADIFGVTIIGAVWTLDDFPTSQRMARILADLQAVRTAYYATPGTPETPTLPVNHYGQVNDIERILLDVWRFWAANTAEKLYCGEMYAGEEIDNM